MRTNDHRGDGDHGALWEVLVGCEFLLESLGQWRKLYELDAVGTAAESPSRRPPAPAGTLSLLLAYNRSDYQRFRVVSRVGTIERDSRSFIASSINNAWSRLNEYYNIKLDDSLLWAASVILHPAFNLQFVEALWQPRRLHKAKKDLQDYLDEWYPAGAKASPTPELNPEPGKRELDRYYRLGRQNTTDPVAWWVSQKSIFPRLSQLALDILAIPAMTADTKRTFSASKLASTFQHQSMSPETFEQSQCIRNWARSGAIQLGSIVRPANELDRQRGGGLE